MLSHAQARLAILEAWVRLHAEGLLPETATIPALQLVQAVGWIESQYGAGWKGLCASSNNWGAVQAGKPPCGPDACEYTDSHPRSDGTSEPYQACFRVYSTPAEGAEHMLRVLLRRQSTIEAALSGDADAFSRAMYAAGYYEGKGRTVSDRIAWQTRRLEAGRLAIATALGEDVPRSSARSGSVSPGFVVFVALALTAAAAAVARAA